MKAECVGTYGVSLEELGRLLAAVPEEREHRGRRDVVCLARAHGRVILEQVLVLGWRSEARGIPCSAIAQWARSRGVVGGRTFVDFFQLRAVRI